MEYISWQTLLGQKLDDFTEKLIYTLESINFFDICKSLPIDHICLRLKNNQDVINLKENISEIGKIISSAEVNGREIIIISLYKEIKLKNWTIPFIELPFPKTNHKYQDGWEHVEFVLNCDEVTMQNLCDNFQQKFSLIDKYKLIYQYSEDEPESLNQPPNPTISLKVNGIGLKFHCKSIKDIVVQ